MKHQAATICRGCGSALVMKPFDDSTHLCGVCSAAFTSSDIAGMEAVIGRLLDYRIKTGNLPIDAWTGEPIDMGEH